MVHGRVADQHKSHLLQVMSPNRFEFKDIETEAIDPEDLEPRRIELDRNLGTDPYQIQERFVRNSHTEDMDDFGKVGADTSHLQSQMHSDYDSAESIADSDLEDGELRKMLGFTTVYATSEKTVNPLECQSHRGNLLHCSHLEAKNREINSRLLFSKTLDSSNLGRSLLEGNKDHLLSQAKSELLRQEHLSWVSQ